MSLIAFYALCAVLALVVLAAAVINPKPLREYQLNLVALGLLLAFLPVTVAYCRAA